MIRRLVLGSLLLLIAASASARDVRVQLYSVLPPSKLSIVPISATLRLCAKCKPTQSRTELTFRADGSGLLIDQQKSAAAYVEGDYEIRTPTSAAIRLRAQLRITARRNQLIVVATMPLDDYVTAVLTGEASTMTSAESLKAMAVAARTYAIRFSDRHKLEDFDLCSSSHCQAANFALPDDRIRDAVEATSGELLWYKGSPAASYYTRNCGGRSEDVHAIWPDIHASYLLGHPDRYCGGSDDSTWEATITQQEIAHVLALLPHAPRSVRTIRIVEHTSTGRARTLHLDSYPVDAQTFRFAVGRFLGWNRIRSDQYEVQELTAGFRFVGRGAGHGVGMCQRGALRMGEQGKTYLEILAYYYPGTVVGVTAGGLSWRLLRGERIDVFATNATDRQPIVRADDVAAELERTTGLRFVARPVVRVFPTVATFRDATGEPGWVAASTRSNIIRLQPPRVLSQRGALQSTLRHELAHILVESHANAKTPLWLREGLVLHFTTPDGTPSSARWFPGVEQALRSPASEREMRLAYAAALSRTRTLIVRNGMANVLMWLEKGIPAYVQGPD